MTTTPGSSCSRPATWPPGRRRRRAAAPARRRARHRRHPGPGLLPVHPRARPRGGHGARRRVHATRSTAPCPRAVGRLPGRIETGRLPGVRRADGRRGLDPTRPDARAGCRRLQLAGMRPISLAVDITNYVMLETGQPLHAYDAERADRADRGPRGRAGEKLRTLDDSVRALDPERPADHRRLRPDRAGRGDGRRVHRGHRATTRWCIEAAHFDALTIARTVAPAQAVLRGVRRFERGRRPGRRLRRRPPRPPQLLVELAAAPCRRRRPWSAPYRPPPARRSTPTCPVGSSATEVDRGRVDDACSPRVGAAVARRRRPARASPRRPGGPTCATPTTTSRRSAGSIGYDTIAPVVPRAPAGRGLTRSQRARRAVTAALAAAGARRGAQLPVRRAERPRPARAARRRPASRR